MLHATVGSEHLLIGILRVEGCTAMRILAQNGFDVYAVREEVLAIAKERNTTLQATERRSAAATRVPSAPAATARAARDKVFICYSHQDREWLNRLRTTLLPLIRTGEISLWDDTQIRGGRRWRKEIEGALVTARVAVLLVSRHFLASDFIAERELPSLLAAVEQEGVTILWVYVSACLYDETVIGEYQAAHDPARTLDEMTEAECQRTLVSICKRIKEAAGKPLQS